MIKNNTQLNYTKGHLEDFLQAKREVELENDKDSLKYKLWIGALNSSIDDLKQQIADYDNLLKGQVQIKSKKLPQLSELLISGRIAKGWTQGKLAEKLDIDVQQIQRYEATNYDSASFVRMVDVAVVLGLGLEFKEVNIAKESPKTTNRIKHPRTKTAVVKQDSTI